MIAGGGEGWALEVQKLVREWGGRWLKADAKPGMGLFSPKVSLQMDNRGGRGHLHEEEGGHHPRAGVAARPEVVPALHR